MDMYGKLSRTLMRRKYEKVGADDGEFEVEVGKLVTVTIPKSEKGKNVVVRKDPLPVLVPKRFALLSSSNDVVDEDWLEKTLRRALAEGRLNILKPTPPEE